MLPPPQALMDESERKLYLLLALQELGSCTHTQLLYFMYDNAIMSPFDISLSLPELINDGHIAKITHPSDSLYMITDVGREALSFFINRLAHSKVTTIVSQAPIWRERFIREKQYVSKVTQSDAGEYIAHCKLVEGSTTILSIDVPAPERALAEKFAAAWKTRAGDIYQYIMSTLGEEEQA